MKVRTIILLTICAVLIAIVSLWIGQQAYAWLPSQASAEAKLVDDLFSLLVTIAAFIFLGVMGAVLYSIATCRVTKGDFSDALPIEGNPTLETVWIIIPILLVVWIAVDSFHVYRQMSVLGPMHAMHSSQDAKFTLNNSETQPSEAIEVFAKQWIWSFRYPNTNVTSTELHLPVNQRTRLAMQSEDVLHGFYIPDFRLKQDIIPGHPISLQFTPTRIGRYRLHDSQFSGTYFAAMLADVYVDSSDDYRKWLSQAAIREPSPASNQAVAEHSQQPDKVIKSGWRSIPPAPPPIVNHPS